ncbi:MAG: deoxyhypusine synthase [Candidatus Hydrogenedentota bacterium]|nr:MAG: deoxyhypusine synthase [Candidatus Hydrogenedentota bacterium]
MAEEVKEELGRYLKDGFADGLEPLEPIDVTKTRTVSAILSAYKKCAFGARSLGEAADVLETMIRDTKCGVILTLSGAMTVAKMGLLVCEMIDRGWVQGIVSTGALMAHGLIEGAGMTHFKARPDLDDEALFANGYDRVYDTYELEKNLDEAEIIVRNVLAGLPEGSAVASWEINRELGRYLKENVSGRAILKSAFEKSVPVFVPAFTDSELGLDLATFNHLQRKEGKPEIRFEPLYDLEAFTELVCSFEYPGIFTIGGGVPRNWAQQFGPYLDILSLRVGTEVPRKRYRYGVRICPEPVHWGGLSGCTYSEGVSWGKFVPPSEGGRFAEVYCDATIVWPLLVRALIERLEG